MSHVTSEKFSIPALIERAKVNLESVRSQLRMIRSASCLERCNTICVFPKSGLTITTDENRTTVITAKVFATQFEPDTAKRIIASVRDGHGAAPVAMSPLEYYTLQENIISSTIGLLEKL